jgi:hypothetical protein
MKILKSLVFIFFGLNAPTLFAQNMGVKLNQGETANTTLDVNGAASLREGTALTLTNGVNNDINLATDYSFYRIIGPTAAFSITGFNNGKNGRLLTVVNTTAQTMTLSGATGSIAANQLLTGGLVFTVTANGSATFQYNTTLTKWVLTSTSGSAANNDYWSINGNGGTTAGTHFIGTTNGQDVVLKANSIEGIRLNTLGNVGIGTAAPVNKLSVNGHTNIANHLAVGANSSINSGSLLFSGSSFSNIVSAQEEFTGNQTTTFSEGILSHISVNATNNPTTEFYAIDGIAEIKSGNTRNYASAVGFYGGSFHRGSGLVANALGAACYAQNKANGTVTNLRGFDAYTSNTSTGTVAEAAAIFTKCINNTGNGTVTNAYGVYVANGTNTGTGAVNNAYGVFIEDQYCSSTNNFNLYSKGGTSKNFFEGYVGIGITAPSHILHINGQGRATNAAWATTSDRRLKDIDSIYTYGLKEIAQINTYRFHYKKDNPLQLPTDKQLQGVIAQELQKVIPEAITQQKDGYLTVNNDPVFWAMLNAIKELNNDYKGLQKEMKTLEKENVQLKELLLKRLVKIEAALKTK